MPQNLDSCKCDTLEDFFDMDAIFTTAAHLEREQVLLVGELSDFKVQLEKVEREFKELKRNK